MPRSPLGAEGPHVRDTDKRAPTVALQEKTLQDASLTAILWPQDTAANSNLCLIDLQGEALLSTQDPTKAAADLQPLQAPPETAANEGQQQESPECELWGIVRWPSAAAASAGDSGPCCLYVGGDSVQGKVAPFVSADGPCTLAVLRRVRRPLLLDVSGCTYTVAEDGDAAAADAASAADKAAAAHMEAWEFYGAIENTVSFCSAPELNPFKEAFAVQAAHVSPLQQPQQQPQLGPVAAATAAAAAAAATADAAAPGETDSDALWLVAASRQLQHMHNSWQLLNLSNELRNELQFGQTQQAAQRVLLLKGRPTAFPIPPSAAQMRDESKTLICSRSSSFSVTQNTIDGEVLVCCREAAPRSDAGDCMLIDDKKTDKESDQRNGTHGVAIVGICRSVLQLEKSRGRIYQVQQLLQLPVQQLLAAYPNSVPPAAVAAGRSVLSSAVLLQRVQASPAEIAAVLLGDAGLPSLGHFYQTATPASTPAASQGGGPVKVAEQQSHCLQQLLRQLPSMWGSLPAVTSRAILYDPDVGGYFVVSAATVRKWLFRIMDCLALGSSSSNSGSSEWFSVGWALEAITDCVQRHGLAVPGLRVQAHSGRSAAAAGDSTTDTDENLPLLTAGLLLQLLRLFCDMRLPQLCCSSYPTALGDSCPPLSTESAAAATVNVNGDLEDLLHGLEKVLSDAAASKETKAAVNPLKLHFLLAAETAERVGLPLQLKHGVTYTLSSAVTAVEVKKFCVNLGKLWQQVPVRILQWAKEHMRNRIAALRSIAAAVIAAECQQQQNEQEAAHELLFAAANRIPLLAMWFHWEQLQQTASYPLSAPSLLRCCTYGFPDLRTDFSLQRAQQRAIPTCLLYGNRPPHGESVGLETAAATARLMHAAAASVASAASGGSSSTRQFAALLPDAEERRAFVQGMLLSPLRGFFIAVEGQLLMLPAAELPLTLRERLVAAFATKTVWREEELQPFLSLCRSGKEERNDLAVELGAPPAGYCFVHQGELSAETMEQVTSFRSRNVPPAFWELD
ncbi:hypothetical protein, conserved [Eimeria tenella]|uniref:Uncharacterized protein n=1 Tax=Eimeria tenella TaxID=5802 RepID=U6L4A3_EIMTE|nr:hypothetical protein, conserved [Eimeria tenella]CDJ43414.1 hypothetical protein, conserved [Eimeria tenella]|eukprot:XP_013234164.1 hypothetical protein, conserved [Eimeria tenella]